MDARHESHGLGTHGWVRFFIAIFVALVMVVTAGAISASGASSTACRVQNTSTGQAYRTLQRAVDAASRGDRLTVAGTCVGTTVIGKKLVIEGVRTPTTGKPKLSGRGKVGVLRVKKAVRVRVRSIEILRGSGGIYNQGRLTLVDVTVRDNEARLAAGVLNFGTLTLEGSSRISHNSVSGFGAGGGVLNEGTLVMSDQSVISGNFGWGAGVSNKGTLVMNDASSIRNNRAGRGYAYGSGGGVDNEGALVMNDASSIYGNRAEVGGGVSSAGTLTMNGTSSIHDNVARGYHGYGAGGGVSNEGTVTLNDASSIHDNVSAGEGGGVYNDANLAVHGTVTMTGSSSIHHNTAGGGGGVLNIGTVTMTGSSSIHDNRAVGSEDMEAYAGGLYNSGEGILNGVVCAPQASANVYGNTPDDCYFFE